MLDNSTPKATAIAFLKALKPRDAEAMREVCHPNATGCLIRHGKPIHTTMDQILTAVATNDGVERDEVSYDEVEHCDGDFATVWTPYNFYTDGKVCIKVAEILKP